MYFVDKLLQELFSGMSHSPTVNFDPPTLVPPPPPLNKSSVSVFILCVFLPVKIYVCMVHSYWTDHGACYYYDTGGYSNYEELLVAVKEDADKMEIPYRYLQVQY